VGKDNSKSSSKSDRGDAKRLKNVAFWYWEYLRRNTLYRRYCDVIAYYFEYFDGIGEFDYLASKEGLDELNSYYYDEENDYDYKNNPYKDRLEKEHGPRAGVMFQKFSFLSEKFRSNFKRVFKHYSEGINTEEELTKLFNKEDIRFESNDSLDIAALLKMYKNWKMRIDDESPTYYVFELEKSGKITIDPSSIMNDPSEVGQEAHAINLIYKSMRGLFEDHHIKAETLEAVYDLVLSGENINSSDEMRLAVLWLWDKAHEDDYFNPAPFDTVYRMLKARINEEFAHSGIWEQILYRRSRILRYYEAVDLSITQMTVIPLKSAKKFTSEDQPNSTP